MLCLQGQDAFLITAAGQDWGLCVAEWVDPPDPPLVRAPFRLLLFLPKFVTK